MIEHEVLDAGLGDADDDDFELSETFDSQLPEHRYLDREVSWLAFNQRVLELAEDPRLPVLERAVEERRLADQPVLRELLPVRERLLEHREHPHP